ncbi:TPA: helix-turn-helix transcriptional regulator [Enterobacter hormaechei]
MGNIYLFSDNVYTFIAMQNLLKENKFNKNAKSDLTVFFFEKMWLSDADISALQTCRTKMVIIFAPPKLHAFLSSFMKGIHILCLDYGMRIEDVTLFLSYINKSKFSHYVIKNIFNRRSFNLTDLEITIVNLVLSGMSIQNISYVLGRTDKAIYQHKRIAMKKMGVTTDAGLVNLGRYFISHRSSEFKKLIVA